MILHCTIPHHTMVKKHTILYYSPELGTVPLIRFWFLCGGRQGQLGTCSELPGGCKNGALPIDGGLLCRSTGQPCGLAVGGPMAVH